MEQGGSGETQVAEALGGLGTAAEVAEAARIAVLLAEQLTLKGEALRSLAQALDVARDALSPLAAGRPVSGPAARSLVTIAMMALGQAVEATEELEVVATKTKRIVKEPRHESYRTQ